MFANYSQTVTAGPPKLLRPLGSLKDHHQNSLNSASRD